MFDLRGLSRAQLLALAHGLTVVFNLTENYVIALNDKGETFAVYSLPEGKARDEVLAAEAFRCS